VIRPRFTVRVRLTLLYTALFVACGAIVVAITYGLLAGSLQKPAGKSTVVQVPDGFIQDRKSTRLNSSHNA